MKLEQSFTIDAPIDVVWETLIDVERVAPCLPGAQIEEAGEDGTYKGTFTVKLGPTTANYNGSLKMDEVDAEARRVTMSARGTDRRGQGGATATIVQTMVEEGGATRIDVLTDFTITGRLARFGRSGMIEDISNRLLRDFSSCLASSVIVAPPEPPPAPVADEPVAAAGATGGEAAAAATTPPPPAPRPAAPPPQAKPISGFSLVLGALLDRLKRLFGRR